MFKYSHRIEKKKREKAHVWKKIFCDVLPPTREKKRPCTTALDSIYRTAFKSIACLPHHPAIFSFIAGCYFVKLFHRIFALQELRLHNWMERNKITKYYVLWGTYFYWNRKHFITHSQQKKMINIYWFYIKSLTLTF